jgi:hypothetical protein
MKSTYLTHPPGNLVVPIMSSIYIIVKAWKNTSSQLGLGVAATNDEPKEVRNINWDM